MAIGVAEGGSGGSEEPPWEVQIARENASQCFLPRMFRCDLVYVYGCVQSKSDQ